jgi:UDP-glucose 4-epimerase
MLENKTVFITGGAGFIANTLIEQYIHRNRIVVYDNFHRNTLSESPFLHHDNLTVIEGDVLDLPLLVESMAGADVVVHAAAIAGIDTVGKDPVRTMRVNMLGTANTLEAARINAVAGRFIDFSTSEIYGSDAANVDENDDANVGAAGEPRWVYAASKLAGEHLSLAYHRQYGLPVTVVRPFNIYGPGQTGEGAIQVFIKKALAGEPIHITGDGSQVRAWCYVTDFVEGLRRCIELRQAIGQTFNIGNARTAVSIAQLAKTVCSVLRSESPIFFGEALKADIAVRIPLVEKATRLLGFTARVSLEHGIDEMAQWMKKANGASTPLSLLN